MTSLGFIGTGNIGNPIARHLVSAGHAVTVFDLRSFAMENLLELGATAAGSPREVAISCRTVFYSLPGPHEVEDATRGRDGLLEGAQAGDVVVDLTTNSVSAVRRMQAALETQGIHYLDCPVTGGVTGAEAGTLTVLGSGDHNAFDRVEPLLRAFAANVFYLGEPGSGTLVKLINNLIVLCSGQLVQEGMVLGAKAGLDPGKLYEMLQASTARPFIGLMPHMVGRRFENPTFNLALATKDVSLALETARDLAVPMPLTTAAHQTYIRALAAGLGDLSFMATLEALEAGANTSVPLTHIERGSDRL
jgi:3-hydroxyisobutyrate dehydrogenase-like beta-hydroxyacid dehydrogenase